MAASTVYAVLRRYRVARLAELDRATGRAVREPVRRYERDRPGELVHVDVKKLGNTSDVLPDERKETAAAFWARAAVIAAEASRAR